MILKYLLTAGALAAVSIPLQAQSVNAGIDAWRNSNYAGAVAIWRPLAEHGNADAEFNLGQAYRLGKGVATNLAAAKFWLEKAAGQDHVDAQTTLGLLLFQNGEHLPALRWLKQAADQAEPRAMLIYGTALFNGDSIAQDPIAGYAYISRANAQGLAAASDILAQIDKLMSAADKRKALALAAAQDKAVGQAHFKADKTARAATTIALPPRTPKPAAATKPAIAQVSSKTIAAAPAPANGGWRIQVGAFSQRSSAEALYRKLSQKTALAGRSPTYVKAGTIIRLQVGPFASRGAAQAACNALGGQACFPVAAK